MGMATIRKLYVVVYAALTKVLKPLSVNIVAPSIKLSRPPMGGGNFQSRVLWARILLKDLMTAHK